MINPIEGLIEAITYIYLLVVLLRLVLQLTRADFYNPISQGVVKATNTPVLTIRKIIPSVGRIDSASVVFAVLVKLSSMIVLDLLFDRLNSSENYIFLSSLGVIYALFDLYFWAVLLTVILSWVSPNANHPGALLVFQITAPLYNFVRGFIPSLGGLDISPIFIILGITFMKQLLVMLAQSWGGL